MNPLVLAVAVSQLAVPPQPGSPEPDPACRICLMIYIHNQQAPDGRELIRTECAFSPDSVDSLRARQAQISTVGTYSLRNWEDWGTWYPGHRIESVEAVLQPPCI